MRARVVIGSYISVDSNWSNVGRNVDQTWSNNSGSNKYDIEWDNLIFDPEPDRSLIFKSEHGVM